MNASMTVKPRNTLVAPQCGHRALHISADASSINREPAPVDGNRIDYGSARVAFDLHHISALHNCQAAVAISASGEFVWQDEIAAFVLRHIG